MYKEDSVSIELIPECNLEHGFDESHSEKTKSNERFLSDNCTLFEMRKKKQRTDIEFIPDSSIDARASKVEVISDKNNTQIDEFLVNDDSSEFDEDDIIPVEGGISSSEEDRASKTNNVIRKLGNNKRKGAPGRRTSEMEIRGKVRDFIQKMNEAADNDEKAYKDGKKAMFKLKMVDEVFEKISMNNWTTYFISEGIIDVLCRWLKPFSDGTPPSLSIRSNILKLIGNMSFNEEDITSTEIGKVVCELWKNPTETLENRQIIRSLIQRWVKLLSRTRNVNSIDLNNSYTLRMNKESDNHLKANKYGKSILYVEPRTARIPITTGYDFKIAPQSDNSDIKPEAQVSVEKQIEIISKKSKSKAKHAMKVSLEGRGL